MVWWDRVVFPMRRVWIAVATRLGVLKTGAQGFARLGQVVSTWEYEDVHVTWGLLRRSEAEVATSPAARRRRRRRTGRNVWGVFNCCRAF